MIVVYKKKRRLTHRCEYCKKKTASKITLNTGGKYDYLYYGVYSRACEKCDFISKYNMAYESTNKTYYTATEITCNMVYLINISTSIHDFDDYNLDDYPYRTWALFIAKILIKNKMDAVLNLRHDSTIVKQYCWEYINTFKNKKRKKRRGVGRNYADENYTVEHGEVALHSGNV